jgi:hypothetical protein
MTALAIGEDLRRNGAWSLRQLHAAAIMDRRGSASSHGPTRKVTYVRASVKRNIVNTNVYKCWYPSRISVKMRGLFSGWNRSVSIFCQLCCYPYCRQRAKVTGAKGIHAASGRPIEARHRLLAGERVSDILVF